ncbi:flavin reductase [Candidatus Moduliflexus flocculans]|uniref:Flavin reductase n=1 Tax=Candidatus Moduliflexus flocculans TaxID=1499966 RepID=A0A0S6VZ53_9BACT|nr:flavin reductase [Candidatus Moduliflexus flocculans]
MNIIGIISSPRKNGNTAALVREAMKGAAAEGVTTQEIFLTDYNIHFCTGCSACLSAGICPLQDDFEQLKQRLYKADGVILGSPTYAASPNAIMKNFIERMGMFERFTSAGFGGKYVVGMSTAGSMGAKKVANDLTELVKGSVIRRGYVSGTLGVSVKGGTVNDIPNALTQAHALGKRLAQDIRSKKSYAWQNLFGRMMNRMFIKPTFVNIAKTQKDGRLRAVYQTLQQQGVC